MLNLSHYEIVKIALQNVKGDYYIKVSIYLCIKTVIRSYYCTVS